MSPSSEQSPSMWVCRLGTVPYLEGIEIQECVAVKRRAQEIPDTLLLLEHPPVYTRGRRAQDAELALGESFYRAQGIEIVPTDRGGRVTYHGPGQLVGYPVMSVSDVLAHLRSIETAIVRALGEEGIAARSRCDEGPDWTGVWVGQRKIASLGVHVSRGVSTHGFAVNVVNDLTPFTWIVPCGLTGVSMTSIANEIGPGAADLERFADRVVASLCRVHGRQAQEVAPTALGIANCQPPPAALGIAHGRQAHPAAGVRAGAAPSIGVETVTV
jgi:lipoyl(octanoyl) transferase